MRLRILQSYVNDLTEQNEVLVQTAEELERDANDRIAHHEAKCEKTAATLKVYIVQCSRYR